MNSAKSPLPFGVHRVSDRARFLKALKLDAVSIAFRRSPRFRLVGLEVD